MLFLPNFTFSLMDTGRLRSYSHMLMPLKSAAKLPKYRRNEYGEVLTSEHHNFGMVYTAAKTNKPRQ